MIEITLEDSKQTGTVKNESMICYESIFGFKVAEDKVPHDVGGVFSIRICTVFVGKD